MLPLMSYGQYADGTDRRTDGRAPHRYITLSARRDQRNKKWRLLCLSLTLVGRRFRWHVMLT